MSAAPDQPAARTVAGRVAAAVDKLLDVAVVGVAVFTVLYHLALLTGLGRDATAALSVIATAAAVWALWRLDRSRAAEPEVVDPEEGGRPVGRERMDRVIYAAVAVGAAVIATFAAVWGHPVFFWPATIVALAMGFGWRTTRQRPLQDGVVGVLIVVGAAIAVAAFTVSLSQWVNDDVFHANRALVISESSGAYPFDRDTITSGGVYPSPQPENDLASFEAIAGTAAGVTGIAALSMFYFAVPATLLGLGALAYWRLGRVLGVSWPAIAASLGLLFVFLFSSNRSIGSFAFGTRGGKSALIVFAVPLIVAFAIGLARHLTWPRWLRLLAANVAAVGLSGTGTVIAPLATFVGLVAGGAIVIAGRRSGTENGVAAPGWWPARLPAFSVRWRTLFAGGAATLYSVLLLAAATLVRVGRAAGAPAQEYTSGLTTWQLGIFGAGGRVFGIITVLLLGGWVLAETNAARRLHAASAAVVLAAMAAIATLRLVADLPLNEEVAWRLAWAIPLPIIAGAAFVGLARLLPWRWAGAGVVAALLVVFIAIASPITDRRNASLGAPRWDVPAAQWEAATVLVEVADGDGVVAAYQGVAQLVPLITTDAWPVSAVSRYTARVGREVESFAWRDRLALNRWLAGGLPAETRNRENQFASFLEAFDVEAVCVQPDAQTPSMVRGFENASFVEAGSNRRCNYWVRVPDV